MGVCQSNQVAAGVSEPYQVKLKKYKMESIKGHQDTIYSLKYSNNGKLLAGTSNNVIYIWDTVQYNVTMTLEGGEGKIFACGFTSDDQYLICGGDDKYIYVFDLENGSIINRIRGPKTAITSLVLFNDSTVIVGCKDSKITFYNIVSGETIKVLSDHGNWVTLLDSSLESNRLLSGSLDKTIKIWDLEENKTTNTLKMGSDHITSISLSDDGTEFVTGDINGNVNLWNSNTFENIKNINRVSVGINKVLFSKGNRYIAYSHETYIAIYDKRNDDIIYRISSPWDIKEMSFSPDNLSLISSSSNNDIFLWRLLD